MENSSFVVVGIIYPYARISRRENLFGNSALGVVLVSAQHLSRSALHRLQQILFIRIVVNRVVNLILGNVSILIGKGNKRNICGFVTRSAAIGDLFGGLSDDVLAVFRFFNTENSIFFAVDL